MLWAEVPFNTQVLLGEVVGFDLDKRLVRLAEEEIPYDTLLVATGSRHHYFGHPEWEEAAPGLKSIEDATTMRRRIFTAFEAAELTADPDRRQALLTFVVVGGGPTGVELAGAVAELAHRTLRQDFRSIQTNRACILLVEGLDRVLNTYPPDLSAKAAKALARLGVQVRTNTTVIDLHPEHVTLKSGMGTEVVAAHTVLWGAGVQASSLGRLLAEASDAEVDRSGRVLVELDLSVKGRPEVFVLGDLANYPYQTGQPLPGVAPVAMQQGQYVAGLIERRLRGETAPPFHYHDHGSMATIGRSAAVADLGWIRFDGLLAWLAWLFIHLIFLIEFHNRLLVLLQWGWNYLTRNRSARLITGDDLRQGKM